MKLAPWQPWLSHGNSFVKQREVWRLKLTVISWGMPFVCQAKSPEPTGGRGSLVRALGVGPLGLGGQRGHTVPCPCRCPCQCCAWESTQGKPGFLLLSASSQTCLLQHGGFSPLAAVILLGWLAFRRHACAPTQPFSTRTAAPWQAAAGVSRTLAQHGAQVGPCLGTPACGGGRPRCHEVCRASASLHAARWGRASVGQLLPAPGVRAVSEQWVESRKRRMGNRIWLRRRRQPRPLGPFPFPAPESPSHSRRLWGCAEGTGMLPPGRAGA